MGKGTEVGIFCGFDTTICLALEWEEGQVFGLVCGLDIAGCVLVQWEV
jgi:hypothetical protein